MRQYLIVYDIRGQLIDFDKHKNWLLATADLEPRIGSFIKPRMQMSISTVQNSFIISQSYNKAGGRSFLTTIFRQSPTLDTSRIPYVQIFGVENQHCRCATKGNRGCKLPVPLLPPSHKEAVDDEVTTPSRGQHCVVHCISDYVDVGPYQAGTGRVF